MKRTIYKLTFVGLFICTVSLAYTNHVSYAQDQMFEDNIEALASIEMSDTNCFYGTGFCVRHGKVLPGIPFLPSGE